MDKKQEFLKKILATFAIEAEENIISLSANLIELEKKPSKVKEKELLEVIYRSAHSLKGASRAVNSTSIERLCHGFEDVFHTVKNNAIQLNKISYQFLHHTIDTIKNLVGVKEDEIDKDLLDKIKTLTNILATIEQGEEIDADMVSHFEKNIKNQSSKNDTDEAISSEKNQKSNRETPAPPSNNKSFHDNTIRIETSKLDRLLIQTEEMLSLRLSTLQRTKDIQNILEKMNHWQHKIKSVSQSKVKLEHLLNNKRQDNEVLHEVKKIVDFCNWTEGYVKDTINEIKNLQNFSLQEVYTSGSKIETLLQNARGLIRVPFSSLLHLFPKMIRDIAKDLNKEIDFSVLGDPVEIDRRILEKFKTPLIHIIRNSIDYGIEKPEIRKNKNKPLNGKITISAEQIDNNKIEVRITDDGAGIDIDKIKNIYISNEKIATIDIHKITDQDCLNYIFSSGVTTSKIITNLSGRGVGLAIVQETIDQLGGTIRVETKKDVHTTFIIQLPVSIITFRGVIIETNGRSFIAPTAKLVKATRVKTTDLHSIENKTTLLYNTETIPIISLGTILELPPVRLTTEFINVLIFEIKDKKIGFVVDKVIGEQEVLVKMFNRQLTRVRNISGASILGSGKVVPVLNLADLFRSSFKSNASSTNNLTASTETKNTKKSILVVEDSITSRTLIKNILEASGYDVTTSVNGIDGYTKLFEKTFDAVVSDVEMPKMNGFELTTKIRADKKTENIPVLLVTSLSKQEDQVKGIEAGANAYIVKSNFDQSNLLETLENLIY